MTDDLRKAVMPVNIAVKQNLKDRDDRARALKRSNRSQADGVRDEEQEREKEKTSVQTIVDADPALKELACPSGIYELTGTCFVCLISDLG